MHTQTSYLILSKLNRSSRDQAFKRLNLMNDNENDTYAVRYHKYVTPDRHMYLWDCLTVCVLSSFVVATSSHPQI